MNPENFINNGGGFSWFTGVIEDINDPMEMGRYRVRCFGYHNDDKSKDKGIPTEDLPWAMTMLPVTSASISGIGQSQQAYYKERGLLDSFEMVLMHKIL